MIESRLVCEAMRLKEREEARANCLEGLLFVAGWLVLGAVVAMCVVAGFAAWIFG